MTATIGEIEMSDLAIEVDHHDEIEIMITIGEEIMTEGTEEEGTNEIETIGLDKKKEEVEAAAVSNGSKNDQKATTTEKQERRGWKEDIVNVHAHLDETATATTIWTTPPNPQNPV